MAYYATSPYALEGDPTPENRVWGFFADPNKSRLPNRLQSPEPLRRNRVTTTRTVSGIPVWPSRDPIEERGGVNLYGFVRNDGVGKWDILGLDEDARKVHNIEECEIYAYIGHTRINKAPKWNVPANKCYYAGALGCQIQTNNEKPNDDRQGLLRLPDHDDLLNGYKARDKRESHSHGDIIEGNLETDARVAMIDELCDCEEVKFHVYVQDHEDFDNEYDKLFIKIGLGELTKDNELIFKINCEKWKAGTATREY